jgi:hypothetical protein
VVGEPVRDIVNSYKTCTLTQLLSIIVCSADNVRENPDGSERMVDWVFESTENDRVHTFIAFAEGTRPKPKNGIHDRKFALGYITHRINNYQVILVNKNTCLSRRVWSMGETSKGTKEHHIGGHGSILL